MNPSRKAPAERCQIGPQAHCWSAPARAALCVTLALLCWATASPAQSERVVTVDPTVEYQEWQGFGTDLSWWAHRVGDWAEPVRSEVTKLVFDPDVGLGFTTARFHLGAGENPSCPAGDHLAERAKIQGYRPTETGPYDWTAAADQRWVLGQAKEVYGVTHFEANSLSPPWWMTVSGCTAGAQTPGAPNLKEDYVDDYALYLADVVQHFRDEWGIELRSLSPFNEPDVAWWVAGSPQEGCCYSQPLMDTVVTAVAAELSRRNLPTTICSPDAYQMASAADIYGKLSDRSRAAIGVISTHSYDGSLVSRSAFRDLALSEGKPAVMSEACHGGRPEGHTHSGMRCALEMAWQITTDLRDMGVSQWVMWTPVEDEYFNVNDVWNANDNWGPIHMRFSGPDAGRYWIAKEFYGLAHYTRFVRPGSVIVETDDSRALAALDRRSKRLALIVYNEQKTPSGYAVRLAEGAAIAGPTIRAFRTTTTQSLAELPPLAVQEGVVRDTLPAESITTYVLPVEVTTEFRHTRRNDNVVGRGSGQFEYQGGWEYSRRDSPVAYWMSVLDADYHAGRGSGPYSSDVHGSQEAGASCAFHFDGTQVSLYGPMGPEYGMAEVSIDGAEGTLVDCYSPTARDRALLHATARLPQGSHTLRVRVTGDRNAMATGNTVAIDEALVTYEAHAPGDAPTAGG